MRLLAGTPFDREPHCDRCDQPESACTCPPLPQSAPTPPPAAGKQTARLSVERRRKGKVVSVVRGLTLSADELAALLSALKGACGAGGTLDGDALEIQGDHRARLRELLEARGYRVVG